MAPRDGSGVYSRPPGTDAVADTTIDSAKYNNNVADVEGDLNLPRPIVAGGTAATSADAALTSLSAEKAKQVVSNWDVTTWRAGSFYAATSATGAAPVAGHAFAGLAYYANASDFVCEATDLTDPSNPVQYVRTQTAGVWNAWSTLASSGVVPGSSLVGDYSFDATVTFPPGSGQVRFNNATQNSTTELFFSHLTATGLDVTTALPLNILNGSEITVRDKVNSTKYKIFTATAAPVLSGGDWRVTVTFKSGSTDLTAQRVQISTTGLAVRYDIAQTLTANQQAQARANAGVTKKNYILNGAMRISQENGTASGPIGGGYYPADMFIASAGGTSGTCTAQNVLSTTPAVSQNRLRFIATVADAAVGASDIVFIDTRIEGVQIADLRYGSAAAKTATLQFGVRAPAGTYSVVFLNNSVNRSYVSEYVIAAGEANTDVLRTITVPGDVTGTWAIDSTVGLVVRWGLMAGTSFQQAAGSWGTGNVTGSPNQFNFLGTGGNTFELFDVGLYEGPVAPPFTMPDYADELAACTRYFEIVSGASLGAYQIAGWPVLSSYSFKTQKRVVPTMGVIGWDTTSNATGQAAASVTTQGFSFTANAVATNPMYFTGLRTTANARL